ncbi:MAG: DUF6611 family protein [Myxococcota bacterium]
MSLAIKAENIITNHVGYAMAAAAIPVPLADIAAVTLVQLDMVKALSAEFEVDYDESRGNALLVALAGASAARLGASVFKVIPVAGSLIGAAAQIALSGASTYAVGQVFRGIYAGSGTLASVDTDSLRDRYEEYVAKGRWLAHSLRDSVTREESQDEISESLERLDRLRRAGVITDQEFERLSSPLIDLD